MRNPQCNLCARRTEAKETNICMYGNALPDSTKEIMIIIDTISPATDKGSGKLLDGQGGTVLRKLLESVNILNKSYITSAVKCWSSNKPKASEIKSCRKYLIEELEEVNPKLIICLGSTAAQGLIGKHIPQKDLRQRFFDIPKYPNCKVAVTFSHNSIFVNPHIYNQLCKDMLWIVNNYKGTKDEFDWKLKVNEPIADFQVYGLDIETTGLNSNTDRILTIALANPNTKTSIGYNIGHTK